ncbi:mechanosensitive ion channel family protein [Winogradskyella bathintestinalis]|uniref:Mechanosensitive ion channel family protein n=1 Tax=Winogradskyella bathintestinalis TaxID=3035208 RepID=A0ABT7ZT49_9FLAO|nr:mechanosensitive ion channel family protein [Winogradskyella bathintestinalis]MDN3492165.1 mechanosensitive ion channel family protein [Winogradskyella bathintestinalis]
MKLLIQNSKNQDIVSKLIDKLEGWWDAIVLKLPNVAIAIAVLIISYFLANFLGNLLLKILTKRMQNQSIRRLLAKALRIIILMGGFFIALGVLDLDKALTSILAGAGVVALAIGLALQSTLSNTFSGVMLSFLPNLKIGDYVETNDQGGYIHEISMRNLVIKRPDGQFVIMPNSKFIEEPFVNYSVIDRGRITVSCGVAYGTDLHSVKTMVTEKMKTAFPQNKNESIEFYFTTFNNSSIDFIVRFWVDFVKKGQMYAAQDKAILLINDLFNENNIEIPFPIRTLNVSKEQLGNVNKIFNAPRESE